LIIASRSADFKEKKNGTQKENGREIVESSVVALNDRCLLPPVGVSMSSSGRAWWSGIQSEESLPPPLEPILDHVPIKGDQEALVVDVMLKRRLKRHRW